MTRSEAKRKAWELVDAALTGWLEDISDDSHADENGEPTDWATEMYGPRDGAKVDAALDEVLREIARKIRGGK